MQTKNSESRANKNVTNCLLCFIYSNFIYTYPYSYYYSYSSYCYYCHSFIMICGPSHEESTKQNSNIPLPCELHSAQFHINNSILIKLDQRQGIEKYVDWLKTWCKGGESTFLPQICPLEVYSSVLYTFLSFYKEVICSFWWIRFLCFPLLQVS